MVRMGEALKRLEMVRYSKYSSLSVTYRSGGRPALREHVWSARGESPNSSSLTVARCERLSVPSLKMNMNMSIIGTLNVHVLGASIFPSAIFGRFTLLFAILRQLHLTFSFLLACLLYHLCRLPLLGMILSTFLVPLTNTFKSSADWSLLRQLAPFDVIIIDQLSASIPLLRWFGLNRVVFYCHFPDLLLSPSRQLLNEATSSSTTPISVWRALSVVYRRPLDEFEEATTGEADKILVNSEFTSRIFVQTFPRMARVPRVVYPGIDVDMITAQDVERNADDDWLVTSVSFLIAPSFLYFNVGLMRTWITQRKSNTVIDQPIWRQERCSTSYWSLWIS